MTFELLTERQASAKLKIGQRTLQRYRKNEVLLEGIHWQRLPSGEIRYIDLLLLDWAANLHDPDAHLQAIENFRSQLPSRKQKRR